MGKLDNPSPRQLHVLISGGGTGGHIFPALSIADAVKRSYPDAKILFVGAENRMEMKRVPAAGYDIIGLPVAGFDRKRLWRNFAVLCKLLRSLLRARKIVRNFKPDIAIGVGGYASGPTLKAAQRAGVPTLLQEQNSFAGVTNKLLAAKADSICVAYPGMERFFPAEKIVMTGNPVRKSLFDNTMTSQEAKATLGFDPDRRLVLVTGGSLGARTLNNAMIEAIESGAAEKVNFQILWQCGGADAERCKAAVAHRLPSNVILTDFISDMAVAYRAAELVVARAGAGTISELELLGKPAILIPSPNVSEDHQRHNAEALSTRGAADMVLDVDAQALLWKHIVDIIENENTLVELSNNISKLALRDSDIKILDQIIRIIGRN